MITLKCCWDADQVLFKSESATSVREALVEATKSGVRLSVADLRGACLIGAGLRGACLGGADLRGADLRGADLSVADLRGADLRGADLRGAKINWQSHDAIAEILLREAGRDIEKRKVAGLILVSRDWCWDQFLRIESSLREWAIDTLAGYVVDGDAAPKILADRKASKTAEWPVPCT